MIFNPSPPPLQVSPPSRPLLLLHPLPSPTSQNLQLLTIINANLHFVVSLYLQAKLLNMHRLLCRVRPYVRDEWMSRWLCTSPVQRQPLSTYHAWIKNPPNCESVLSEHFMYCIYKSLVECGIGDHLKCHISCGRLSYIQLSTYFKYTKMVTKSKKDSNISNNQSHISKNWFHISKNQDSDSK